MAEFAVWKRGRLIALGALLCAGLGIGGMVWVQANASAGAPRPVPAGQPRPGQAPARTQAPGAVTPSTKATNAHCGQRLTASLTLNGDLTCSGTGLVITGDSVNLDLGGHQITGPGPTATSQNGVAVKGTSDTVQNGVVTGFNYGVYVQGIGRTATILNLRATNSASGIVDSGTGTKITTSVVGQNLFDGIVSAASGGIYSGDHEVSNGNRGLVVFGSKLVVTGNIATGNALPGILDTGIGTTLTKNIANFNAQDGIDARDTTVIDGGGNTAKGNDYADGYVPQQCYGIVCT